MQIREVLKRENDDVKLKFMWDDMSDMATCVAESMPSMHAVSAKKLWKPGLEVWRVLTSKENRLCARKTRSVSSCIDCLRLGFCESVSSELREAAEENGDINHKYKGA